ncbi:MAG: PilZ domain-containing protein [Deltaproteobacteria bacterium]|nr:PilZ domain-containing protein [Deltaproteobacteria bacterium]
MENEGKSSRSIEEGTENHYLKKGNGSILINFKHVKYDQIITHKANPLPCLGDNLECVWAEAENLQEELIIYKFKDILVPCGQKVLLIKSDEIRITDKGISLILPETCYEVDFRKLRRHSCKGVKAQLIQNSVLFNGDLIDFNTGFFRVQVRAVPPQTFQWIDLESPANLIFSNEHEMLYSGECRIIKQNMGQKNREYIIEPLSHQIRRFKQKEFRSTRQELVPSPNIVFSHPFTQKTNNLKVFDLSGSGFSVEEDAYNAILFPGLIIPELEIYFVNSFNIKCKAQVVYKKIMREEKGNDWAKCGLAVLDMDMEDHGRLSALLHQAKNRNSYICNIVDLDDLWNFFFKSGFIYPQKYAFLEANKDKIKETYKKIYTQNPKIARHFVYQDKGRILGHMAMIRFYENSWLIHHHAADRSVSRRAGVAVLDQIGRFLHDSHRLYSNKMNFVFCYFRPENKFPSRVFGGITENTKDTKGCSIDTFAYFHYQKIFNKELKLPEPWKLIETQPEDLLELKKFYEHSSGGLMLNALELEQSSENLDNLSKEYQELGLKRERHLVSLKKDGRVKAVVMINISDIGLNLADLTSTLQVIVVDSDGFTKEIFHLMVSELSAKFEQDDIPVLIYPVEYPENHSIPYEKQYNLWVLNTQYGDHYFRHLKGLLKRAP